MPCMHKFIKQSAKLASISIYLITNEIKHNILFLLPRIFLLLLLRCVHLMFPALRWKYFCEGAKMFPRLREEKLWTRKSFFIWKLLRFRRRVKAKIFLDGNNSSWDVQSLSSRSVFQENWKRKSLKKFWKLLELVQLNFVDRSSRFDYGNPTSTLISIPLVLQLPQIIFLRACTISENFLPQETNRHSTTNDHRRPKRVVE